jgi:hypothetical protein
MTIRRNDNELDLHFGGRAAYLADIKARIETLTAEIESGNIEQAEGAFADVFGARTAEDAKRELADYIAAYELNK